MMIETAAQSLRVALVQTSPVLLDRAATLDRVSARIEEAAVEGAQLVCFGEALVPGYPSWLSLTGGARFNDAAQKELHARYLREAVDVERGDLDSICRLAKRHELSVYLGVMERPAERGGHSLYCSLVYIDQAGRVASVHRKLMPTYEERLSWSPGDGHGLRTHALGAFRVGGLNCWENWMPLARAALYAEGEDLHVATWPGASRNTRALSPVLAREGRSFVISVSGVLHRDQLPHSMPQRDAVLAAAPEWIHEGGSCVAAPDGSWVIEPQVECEGIFFADLNHARVLEERQNFDPSGHYSRPDVLQLSVDRRRQRAAKFQDD